MNRATARAALVWGLLVHGLRLINTDAATFAYETTYPWVITDTINFPAGRIALGIQSNGKIVMAGDFSKASSAPSPTPPGISTPGILRLTTEGALDPTFNPGTGITGGSLLIDSLTVQADDKIIVSGRFTTVGGKTRSNCARLNADGSVDPGFTADCNERVFATAVMKDGRIYLAGSFTSVNGKAISTVVRLNGDGSVDSGFSPAFGSVTPFGVQAMGVQSDGKVILAGGFMNSGKFTGMVRLNLDGSVDATFALGEYTLSFPAANFCSCLKVLADDRILLGGGFSAVNQQPRKALARFQADGTLDASWAPAVPDGYNLGQLPRQIVVQGDGGVLFGKLAAVNRVGNFPPETVIRFNADGSLDAEFLGLPGDFLDASNGLAMVAQPDGRIIVAIRALSSEYRLKRFGAAAPAVPPVFTAQPASQTVAEGSRVVLSAGATGTEPLTYQWLHDGVPIAGGNSSTLLLASIQNTDRGSYVVEVSNAAGKITSAPAVLTVVGPQPQGLAPLALGTTANLASASFLNANAGAVAGSGGQLLITTNGGQTWTRSPVGVTNDLTSIRYAGAVTFLSGSGGLLCISTNNGLTWRPFETGTPETFYGLAFSDSQNGFAVGSRGTICRYNGRGWTPVLTDTLETFYDVSVIGTFAYAVGSRGTICRYNGTRWVAQPTGVTTDFYGVDFFSDTLGLAVGANGLICRYNGTGWVPLTSGVTANLRSVRWVNESIAFVIGDGGIFLQTVNGGSSWQVLSLGTSGNLAGLAFSSGRGYVFGFGGLGFAFGAPGFTVNLPPVIRIVSPTNGEPFQACLPIHVEAETSDPDGTIRGVRFYRGEFLLAEIVRASRPGVPYRTSFHTDVLGTYELRAVATDNLGAATVSLPITIQVVAPPLETAVVESFDLTNGCALCLRGLAGTNYVLEGTPTLAPPVPWTSLQTNTAPDPLLRAVDLTATNYIHRFYRFRRWP